MRGASGAHKRGTAMCQAAHGTRPRNTRTTISGVRVQNVTHHVVCMRVVHAPHTSVNAVSAHTRLWLCHTGEQARRPALARNARETVSSQLHVLMHAVCLWRGWG